MKPNIALSAAYGVVDERGAEIARLQEENERLRRRARTWKRAAKAWRTLAFRGIDCLSEELALRDHRIDCLSQALHEAVEARKEEKERTSYWIERAVRYSNTSRRRWLQAQRLARQQPWKRRRPQ